MLGFLKKNWLTILLYFIPLALTIALAGQSRFSPFKLFPNPDYNYQLKFFADDSIKGRSTITNANISNTQFSFTYQLKPGIDYPYAGCIFKFAKNSRLWIDLSDYEYFIIKIKSTFPRLITLFLKTFDDKITNANDSVSFRHNQEVISLDSRFQSFKISLKRLGTPQWWFENFSLDSVSYPAEQFKKVSSFEIHEIHTQDRLPAGEELTLTVEEITFYPDNHLFFSFLFIVGVCYVALTMFLLVKSRKNGGFIGNHREFPYKRVEVESYENEDWSKLNDFLKENYTDSELSLCKINIGTGLSEKRVSALIKKKHEAGFNSFINRIRVNEAKRLLEETDYQVTEIAYMVGYKNISHFNRVFKQLTDETPVEYRKNRETLS
ncbi:MAG: AraC family transcriptional regulator [Spirochaetales bacterium]|nr:AraC family transcriptional regulator [Spirochaetales bacterium]